MESGHEERSGRARQAMERLTFHAHAARVVLESRIDPDLSAMVDLARAVMKVPVASISILDGDRFHFLVASGIDAFCADRDEAICRYSMEAPGIFEVPDTLEDERLADLPYVNGDAGDFRFYASAPIRIADGMMIGRFCLFDLVPRSLSDAQRSQLTKLAGMASRLIDGEVAARMRREGRLERWSAEALADQRAAITLPEPRRPLLSPRP